MKKQRHDKGPSPAQPLMFALQCLAQSFLLKHMWPLLEQANTPTTLQISQELVNRFISSVCCGPFRDARVRAFFHDSRHAADVCLGSVQSRTNVQLALTSQPLLSYSATYTAMEGTWEMNVHTTRPLSELWALFLATMSLHVGCTFVKTQLTFLEVMMTSSKSSIGNVTLAVNTHTTAACSWPKGNDGKGMMSKLWLGK